MENKALAKTDKEKTIKEHTNDLLYQYHILKNIHTDIMSKIDWGLLKRAAIYHDLGKVNSKFQIKLYKVLGYRVDLQVLDNEDEVPHNFLSPLFIDVERLEKKYGLIRTKILVSAIYYHHDREEKEISENDIEDLKRQAKYIGIKPEKVHGHYHKYLLKPDSEKDTIILESKEYIQIKGYLNRLDHIASLDRKEVNIEEEIRENGQTVADKIKEITKKKYKNNYRKVQEYMMKNQNENLVVISYTGSGKTEAALLWIGENKAFYTLPLKVSINAMYKRITKDIGYHKALLLHSDAYEYYQNENENSLSSYERAKKMSSPLIVTTIDQLFKIAFKYRGYEEILSILSYSKVIIDEIQMYSPELLAYILLGLKMITKMDGKFAIITATFPPVLYDFMKELEIPYKEQREEFVPHINQRHRVSLLKGEFDYEYIKKEAKNKKVLIVVNTIKRAQEIYEELKEENNVHLLHSHYLKKDRAALEDEILKFGNREENDENGIWISTQIVEASLDIDFDILFTEMCSIDSLLQRMGRVFRKRQYDEMVPNIYILDNRNGVPYIIDECIYNYTLNELEILLQKNNNQILLEEIKQEMIKNIFDLEKNKELKNSPYYKKIKKAIRQLKNIRPNQMPHSEIIEKFRNIQNVSLIPDNIFEQLNNGKIDKWNQMFNTRNISTKEKMKTINEIKQYTIDVRWSPKLERDTEELFYRGSNIYRTRYQYDFNEKNNTGLGLIMKNMSNIGYFDE